MAEAAFFLRNSFIDLFNYCLLLINIIFTIIAFINIDLIAVVLPLGFLNSVSEALSELTPTRYGRCYYKK